MSNYAVPERAEMTFAAVRHETGDELEALGEGCRVAVAEELRRLADERMAQFETERSVCEGPISRCVFCAAAEKGALQFATPLRARANRLDPEGATR